MFEKAEDAMKHVGQIPQIQSKVDALTKKVEGMIDSERYVECDACGSLVNKGHVDRIATINAPCAYYVDIHEVANGVYVYNICNHCDVKKFKKENYIK